MKPINLIEHPEGGRFCEVFKSDALVTKTNAQTRSALTHIYFSLNNGEVSRFHKVQSDEVWNLYQGTGLFLYTWDSADNQPQCHELSSNSNSFCHIVPAGTWQAAEPIQDTVLVGCTVSPGFEFVDFELIDSSSNLAKTIQAKNPSLSKFIIP